MTFSYAEQVSAFNTMRDQIDRELRATGFEEFITAHGLDATAGRLVVARDFDYSSSKADLDIGFDPTATRLATQHIVGVMTESTRGGWSFHGKVISEALHGEAQQPAYAGEDLDYIQIATVTAAAYRLLDEKSRGRLPFLTKSLKKIDPAGD